MRGERFDLIATNPPFVISPATGERLVYRDSGLPGDRVVEAHRPRRARPPHRRRLVPGARQLGRSTRDRPWDERLAGWVADGCDALVVQREVVDPAAYVELWLKDAGLHGGPDYLEPLRHLARLVRGAGHRGASASAGSTCAAGGADRPERFLDWPYDVEQPVAPGDPRLGAGGRAPRSPSDDSARRLRRRTSSRRRPASRAPRTPRRSCCASSAACAGPARPTPSRPPLVGACDGDLTVGQILDAVATLPDRDPGELRAAYLPVVRELLVEGFLTV